MTQAPAYYTKGKIKEKRLGPRQSRKYASEGGWRMLYQRVKELRRYPHAPTSSTSGRAFVAGGLCLRWIWVIL